MALSQEERLERRRASYKKWREANPEKAREASRKWAAKNKDHLRQRGLERYQNTPVERIILTTAKSRAKRAGVPFNITLSDIEIPERCPVLGIPLCRGAGASHDNSSSLDRIVPELGYVPGNIAMMSSRANRLKNNGTAEEHRKIADWIDANVT